MATIRATTPALAGPSTASIANRRSLVSGAVPVRAPVCRARGLVVMAGGPGRAKWTTKGSTEEEKAAFDFGHDDWHHTYKPGKGPSTGEYFDTARDAAGGPATGAQTAVLGVSFAAVFASFFFGGTVETTGNALCWIGAVSATAFATLQIIDNYSKDFPGITPFAADIAAKPLPFSTEKKTFDE